MKNFLKRIALVLGYILGIYLILRGIVEPFALDYGNAASYKQSWGGPTLVGVMAVHILPGVISAILIYRHQKNRHRKTA